MPRIPVSENPRRRRRHSRRLTAAQLAAGFGGKRSMSGRRHRRRSRRYRNPALAVLAGNPRRRRHYRAAGRRRVRHYRNPGMLGGITSMIDIKGAAYVAGGIIIAKAGPNLIRKVWAGAPTDGLPGHAVRLGAVLLAATGVRYLLKSPKGAQEIAVGGLGYILYDLANQYLLPTLGLAGLTDDGDYVTTEDAANFAGYQPSSNGMNGYVPSTFGTPELAM